MAGLPLAGGLSDSESTFPGNIIGGFGVKTNALRGFKFAT